MPRYEDDGAPEGAFHDNRAARNAAKIRRRGKRLKKRGVVSDLVWDEDASPRPTTDTLFSDPDLQELYDRGYLDGLGSRLRGGKEATVYTVRRGEQWLVAKLYTDRSVRSFKDDASYWSGFWIGDARTAKAMRKGSRAGNEARQAIWVMREYTTLWRLYEAGLPVPKPAVGPEASELSKSGSVVLMELIGDGDEPAPRLSDVRLEPGDARSAWDQSYAIMLSLAHMGLVHGDFSTYNLLWHRDRVWLIDVPQTVEAHGSPEAVTLLRRDLASLATSFRRLGVEPDLAPLERRLVAALREAA
ncbi:MAG TPA: RIO1 family regulatory kinase/ATPase [Trueperaceae bacterium]